MVCCLPIACFCNIHGVAQVKPRLTVTNHFALIYRIYTKVLEIFKIESFLANQMMTPVNPANVGRGVKKKKTCKRTHASSHKRVLNG